MKKIAFYLICVLSLGYMMSCTPLIQHADPFYNLNGSDYPRGHIPLINPVQVTRDLFSSSWNLELLNSLHIDLPKRHEKEVVKVYIYSRIAELERFAVQNGVIMAYSAYINKEADTYIQENYFHWFVIIPEKEISEGFHTEDAFHEYIQSLGVEVPDWQTPDEAYEQFLKTGCLEWIPDCE